MVVALQNSRSFGPFTRVLSDLASPAVAESAWRAVGLLPSIVEGPPLFLPYRIQAELAEAAARRLGERHLGAVIASHYAYDDLDLYAAYVLDAPRLDKAFERGARALRYINSHANVSLAMRDGHLILSYHSGIAHITGSRHINEGIPFLLTDLVCRYVGAQWRPSWVELPGARPTTAAWLCDLYGAPVHFGADAPGVAIQPAILPAPNPIPPGTGSAFLRSDLIALVRGGPPRTVTRLVLETLRLQLRVGDLSAEAVARRIGLGVRTLQRRLGSESTDFRDLRSEFLMERASELLLETDHDLPVIASALGYEEVNSFRRAFRTWKGVSPTGYRSSNTGALCGK